MSTTTSYTTWADHHPDVTANFARRPIPWPCEKIETDLAWCHQPLVVKAVNGELFSLGTVPAREDPIVWHSPDGGKSWGELSRTTLPLRPVPREAGFTSALGTCLGVTASGAILIAYRQYYCDGKGKRNQGDPSCHDDTWIIRSDDRGKTWREAGDLDPTPYQCMGGGKECIHRMGDGRMIFHEGAANWSRPGKPLPKDAWRETAVMFESTDDGRSWQRMADLAEHGSESSLLELPSGRILAATRYQRKKLAGDPQDMVSPTWLDEAHRADCETCREVGPTGLGGHSIIKQTAVLHSDDGGQSWSTPRLVTGWHQQTACFVRLSDGTVVMPYGHKDDGHGQRFILSYDEGQTWSNAIFELNKFGMYAHSVVLDDDSIVTVTETPRKIKPVKLHVLRWKAPPRTETEKHGFFTPRLAH